MHVQTVASSVLFKTKCFALREARILDKTGRFPLVKEKLLARLFLSFLADDFFLQYSEQ